MRRGRRRAIGALLLLVLTGTAVAVATAVAGAAWHSFVTGCTLEGLRPQRTLGQSSYVYASDGTYLATIRSEVHRQTVGLDAMSPWLKKATVAIEDRRFWQHPGVDVKGTMRAALRDIRAGRALEGASTLDQQLVDVLYLPDEPHTIAFKKREACLALKLDKAWGKERVLRRYLNTVYYGHFAYGVEAAAKTYFGRPAKTLGPAQAALVAGLPQAPSRYDPLLHPKAALARRNQVLRAMAATGVLSPATARGYERLPLNLRPTKLYETRRLPAFVDYVRSLLVDAYGERRTRRGGFRVTTTIDPRLQRLAHRAVDSTLERPSDPATALVSVDRSGAIRALVSHANGGALDFNLATQGRNQAGSTFKTFVLAAAVEQGMNPYATRYESRPFHYDLPNGQTWNVHTYEGTYAGVETVTRALTQSDNTVFARLTVDVGPRRVAETARRLGITSPLDPVPSIGLGVNDVSVLEMASAYSTLMRLGVRRDPYAISKVVLPNGKDDPRWGPSPAEQVLSGGAARTVDQVLEENVDHGTGVQAQIGRPAAGKTGTTEHFTDAWFVGFTRRLTTAVWVGYPHRNVPMRDVHGIAVQGGSFPAQIWARFMGPATKGEPSVEFPPAGGVEWQPWEGAHAAS